MSKEIRTRKYVPIYPNLAYLLQTYVASQQLESLAWRNDGSQFVSAHNDGSYVVWSTQGSTEPLEPPNAPYGPYPCKAINKILWAHENG